MATAAPVKPRQQFLNKMSPAANRAKLGDVLADLVAAHNDLRTKYIALLTKLDNDAGVTDINYTSLESPTLPAVVDIESR